MAHTDINGCNYCVRLINPTLIAVASPRAPAELISTSQLAYIGYTNRIAGFAALIL